MARAEQPFDIVEIKPEPKRSYRGAATAGAALIVLTGGFFAFKTAGSESTNAKGKTVQTRPETAPAQPEAELQLPNGVIYRAVTIPQVDRLPGEPEGAEIVRREFLTRWEAFKTNNAYLLEQFWAKGRNHDQFQAELERMGPTPEATVANNPEHLVVDEVIELDLNLIEAHYHLETNGQTYQTSQLTLMYDEKAQDWGVITLNAIE